MTITSLTQLFVIRTFIRRCSNYYRTGIKLFLKSTPQENNFFLKRTFAFVFPYAYILLGMDEKAVAWISMHKVQCVSMDRWQGGIHCSRGHCVRWGPWPLPVSDILMMILMKYILWWSACLSVCLSENPWKFHVDVLKEKSVLRKTEALLGQNRPKSAIRETQSLSARARRHARGLIFLPFHQIWNFMSLETIRVVPKNVF